MKNEGAKVLTTFKYNMGFLDVQGQVTLQSVVEWGCTLNSLGTYTHLRHIRVIHVKCKVFMFYIFEHI